MKMTPFHLIAPVLLAAALPATAGEYSRYAPVPPVVLSPDLSEPWLVQLRPPAYRDGTEGRPVIYHRGEPDIGLWRGDRPIAVAPEDHPVVHQATYTPAPAAHEHSIDPEFLPTEIDYHGPHKPGTVVIDTNERHLYLIEDNGRARRYGVGVGRPGFQWAGQHTITRKAEWPDWTPPDAMLKRQPHLPRHMDGGPNNPLGARAMYLGSTEYRIHVSNEPWTIGHAVSSGCIRMRNEDVTDLYSRVRVGTRVIVM